MKQFITLLTLILLLSLYCEARVRYVDKNGGKDQFGNNKYTTIQAAIDAAIDGDTVRVYPGVYNEAINIGKNIVVQGGGINTILTGGQDRATVYISNGKIMWFSVTNPFGAGIDIHNAIASNCICHDCRWGGFHILGPNAKLYNCISHNNKGNGFWVGNDISFILYAINCIALDNEGYGFGVSWLDNGCGVISYCCAYGNSENFRKNFRNTWSFSNCVEDNPGFDAKYRVSINSKCFNSGDPTIFDLDGTRSDMGYYGGPDAPLLPYVTMPVNYKLNPDGTMQFDMQGKVGY